MPYPKPDAAITNTFLKTRKTSRGLLGKLDRYAVPVAILNIILSVITIVISIIIMQQKPSQPVFQEVCIDCANLTRSLLSQQEFNGFSRRLDKGTEMCCATNQEQMTALLNASQPVLQEVCIDCADLTRSLLSQQEVNGFSRRLSNDTEMCCATNQKQMTALLIASMREQVYDSDFIDTSSIVAPVSAHKRLGKTKANESLWKEEPYFNGGKKHFEAPFDKDLDPVTEHVLGVEVLDSALRINYTGLYYVYFSNYLGPKFNIPAKDFDYQSWLPYVFRKSPNNPAHTGRLLQTSYNAHGDSVNPEETVYSGGTFDLRKGDELQVCISGLGLVRYTKEASFLGVVKLSGDFVQR